DPLLPQAADDIVDDLQAEAWHVEGRGDAVRHLVIAESADGHHGQAGQLVHRAFLDSADDLDESAERLTSIVGLQPVDLGYAIEEGDDPGIGADRRPDVGER